MRHYLQCRWCKWRVQFLEGKSKSISYNRLLRHVRDRHEDEWEKLAQAITEQMGDELTYYEGEDDDAIQAD